MRRRRDLRLCGLALLVTLGFAALHLAAPDLRWARILELYTLDLHIRLRGGPPVTPAIAIVMIDDRSIAALGQWPVPRRLLATLIDRLHRAGAKAIGLDVLLAEPGRGESDVAESGDAALADAMRNAGNVVIPFTFRFGGEPATATPAIVARAAYGRLRDNGFYRPLALAPSGLILPLPALADAANLGHMLVAYDVDGSARYEYPALEYDLDYYPSMAVRLAQLYLGIAWRDVLLELGDGISLGPLRVPTDPTMRLLIDYARPSGGFATYSLSPVLAGAVPDDAFRGRIVLIGANVVGARDTFKTPFTAVMPGVERLAAIVNSMLAGRYLSRPAIMPWLEAAAMLLMAVLLGFAVSRLHPAFAALVAISFIVLLAVSSQMLLARDDLWQATAVPTVALILTFTTLALYRYALLDREHRHIRRVFQRYLSPAMVDRLAETDQLPELGGELREITILFCDLRGFTGLSERVAPARLTRLANAFLSTASEAIFHEGGTVDKYMGDAIMAFWNAPIAQPDHALRACRAALDIIGRLASINRDLARTDEGPLIAAGIGINTGLCVVGNFGSDRRLDYSAIGDAVNIAARLETETRNSGCAILLGPATSARATGLAMLPLGPLELRGRVQAIEVHALVGDTRVAGTAGFAALSDRWQAHDDLGARRAWDQLAADTPLLQALCERFPPRRAP